MEQFKLVSEFSPAGDQPKAIASLTEGLHAGKKHQVLLGVTGSGKTFTMANVIANVNRPALILAHNKTLAAQLYRELKDFFPHNAVEYFVSYYDYYQPEAYVPARDLYIDKDAQINDEIDRMRLKATSALVERRDVVIVASVSCIYGLGSPDDYRSRFLLVEVGKRIDREEIIEHLVHIQYARTRDILERSRFRVVGDMIEIMSAYSDEIIRIELFGDEIERITKLHGVTREKLADVEHAFIYPAKHFVIGEEKLVDGAHAIEKELTERYDFFKRNNQLVEAERLWQRTKYDLEMLRELGYCSGIENYSRHLSGRNEGERPATLLDYFPSDFITIVDESHATLPQVRGMFVGDRSRKQTLVDFGFRLPSALDNRPLYFDEFNEIIGQRIYVSATPAEYERALSENTVEQIIRPTGLVDPEINVRETEGQIDYVLQEIQPVIKRNERIFITTLTKKMAEDLTRYLNEAGVRVRYLHSDIETVERVEILRDLRKGEFDVLVGINLLREGLDVPEVSLVLILDADKIGFLRSTTALIQTVGRAARNVNGRVVMFADKMSSAMSACIEETARRRTLQVDYNTAHNITPKTIVKTVKDIIDREAGTDISYEVHFDVAQFNDETKIDPKADPARYIQRLELAMKEAAGNLEFEKAIEIRSKIADMKRKMKEAARAGGKKKRKTARGLLDD